MNQELRNKIMVINHIRTSKGICDTFDLNPFGESVELEINDYNTDAHPCTVAKGKPEELETFIDLLLVLEVETEMDELAENFSITINMPVSYSRCKGFSNSVGGTPRYDWYINGHLVNDNIEITKLYDLLKELAK